MQKDSLKLNLNFHSGDLSDFMKNYSAFSYKKIPGVDSMIAELIIMCHDDFEQSLVIKQDEIANIVYCDKYRDLSDDLKSKLSNISSLENKLAVDLFRKSILMKYYHNYGSTTFTLPDIYKRKLDDIAQESCYIDTEILFTCYINYFLEQSPKQIEEKLTGNVANTIESAIKEKVYVNINDVMIAPYQIYSHYCDRDYCRYLLGVNADGALCTVFLREIASCEKTTVSCFDAIKQNSINLENFSLYNRGLLDVSIDLEKYSKMQFLLDRCLVNEEIGNVVDNGKGQLTFAYIVENSLYHDTLKVESKFNDYVDFFRNVINYHLVENNSYQKISFEKFGKKIYKQAVDDFISPYWSNL